MEFRIWIVAVLLAVAAMVMAGSGSTQAQVIDATPCQSACYEDEQDCIAACGEHDNPMECEQVCQEQYQDCFDACPQE